MATILWCYLRNDAFKKDGKDYHVSSDLTAQANHLGATIEADIIKQLWGKAELHQDGEGLRQGADVWHIRAEQKRFEKKAF